MAVGEPRNIGPSLETGPDPRPMGSCGDLGHWCILLWVKGLQTGIHMAVEAGEESQTGGMQVHSWKGT